MLKVYYVFRFTEKLYSIGKFSYVVLNKFTTVKPLYSGHLLFLKKVSAINRVLHILQEKYHYILR